MIVQGNSGTGKTFFVKSMTHEIVVESSDFFSLYVDISNDDFQSSKLVDSLLKMSMLPSTSVQGNPVHIDSSLTLEEYLRSEDRVSSGWTYLKNVSKAAASLLGIGNAIDKIISDDKSGTILAEDILSNYLEWVAKKKRIIIIIDNYQFLSYSVRQQLESALYQVKEHLSLIIIDRTIENESETFPYMHKEEFSNSIFLESFSLKHTYEIIEKSIECSSETLDQISHDIYSKTGGLAKDIEYCIKKMQLEMDGKPEEASISGLLSTIDKLPIVHKQLLFIASILDGGVHKDIARKAIARGTLAEESDIESILRQLISLEYLKINSDTGNRIRAGHERVIQVVNELGYYDEYNDIRISLIEEFIAMLDMGRTIDDEIYLLHCLIGIQTAMEIRSNLHYLSRLITSQFRQEQFSYIVNLAKDADELLVYLHPEIVTMLLDSMQKSSSFESGLALLQDLEESDKYKSELWDVYKYKFFYSTI